MKLLTKTSLYYLYFSIPVLCIAGFTAYFLITHELKENTDELLWNRKLQVETKVSAGDSSLINLLSTNGEADIIYQQHKPFVPSYQFSDSSVYDANEDEYNPCRVLQFTCKASDGYYIVKLFRSTVEYDNLYLGIFTSLFLVLIFLLVAYIIISLVVSRMLWKPFYTSMAQLSGFSLTKKNVHVFEPTSIKEFTDLNAALNAMTSKMVSDYLNQKKFTEHASHELQTPLAVVQSKIDLLIQSEKLGEEEMELIKTIHISTNKMSRLIKSLLLLSKIENRQYTHIEEVSINDILTQSLSFFELYIQSKNISVVTRIHDNVTLHIHHDLCDMLINNLIQNAIKHNNKNGIIDIELTKKHLIISNTGDLLTFDAETIFDRFVKSDSATDSIGLGLSVAKEIATACGLTLRYEYTAGIHAFSIIF